MSVEKTIHEQYVSLLSQTKSGVLDSVRTTMPEEVMQVFEEEPSVSTRDVFPHVRAWRWLHQNSGPHKVTHLYAVILGLLLTGGLVLLVSTLHTMMYSQEIDFLSVGTSLSPTSPPSHTNMSKPSPADLLPEFNDMSNTSLEGPASAPTIVISPINTTEQVIQTSDTQITNTSLMQTPSDTGPNVSIPICRPEPISELAEERVTETPSVYYQNMSATWNFMTDEELSWKASMSSLRSRGAPSHTARIAHMFMTVGPLHFAPLWERYFHGHQNLYTVYIHAHPNYVPTYDKNSPFFGRFIPSKEVKWGRISVYEAERRLLGNALLDSTNEWFVLLSESCIPLYNFPDTYKYLTESKQSFIEAYNDGAQRGRGRLYGGLYKKMAPEITPRNFRKGSQWFQINRDLALVAVSDTTYYDKFEKYFCHIHPVCYIDEHYLPTLASITRPKAIAYRTITFFEFRGTSPHPHKWGKENTDKKLIKWIREGHNCTYNGAPTSDCFHFVRKFDPSALEVLLDLASPVMGIP